MSMIQELVLSIAALQKNAILYSNYFLLGVFASKVSSLLSTVSARYCIS